MAKIANCQSLPSNRINCSLWDGFGTLVISNLHRTLLPASDIGWCNDTQRNLNTKKDTPKGWPFLFNGCAWSIERARSTNASAFGPRREGGAQPDEARRAITAKSRYGSIVPLQPAPPFEKLRSNLNRATQWRGSDGPVPSAHSATLSHTTSSHP